MISACLLRNFPANSKHPNVLKDKRIDLHCHGYEAAKNMQARVLGRCVGGCLLWVLSACLVVVAGL